MARGSSGINSTFTPRRTQEAPQDTSLGGALKSSFHNKNVLMGVLDLLGSGSQATAGMALEQKRRDEGYSPQSMWNAFKGGIRQDAHWSQVTGDPYTGFAMDVLGDPTTYGGGAAVKGIAKLSKATTGMLGATRAAEVVGEYVEATAALRKTRDALQKAFITDRPGLKRVAPELLEERSNVLAQQQAAIHEANKSVDRVLKKLVPDELRREELGMMQAEIPVEIKMGEFLSDPIGYAEKYSGSMTGVSFSRHSPRGPTGESNRAIEFLTRFRSLPANERDAFIMARQSLEEMKDIKLATDRIDAARMAGLEQSAGFHYAPHRTRKGDKLPIIGEDPQAAKTWKERVAGAKAEPMRIPDEMDQAIDQYYVRKAEEPSFAQTRQGKSLTLRDKIAMGYDDVLTDLSDMLKVESKEVAGARAQKMWKDTNLNYLKKSGYYLPEGLVGDRRLTHQFLLEKFGDEKIVQKLMRDGFMKTTVKELEGFAVPRSIGKELDEAVGAMDQIPMAHFNLIARMTSLWKAATTLPFAAFHTRNFGNDALASVMAGMNPIRDPHVVEDARNSLSLMTRWAHNGFADNPGQAIKKAFGDIPKGQLFGTTEDGLRQVALRYHIIQSGMTMGEFRSGMDELVSHPSTLRKIVDPNVNPFVRKMAEIGSFGEDWIRLSHFMWRLRKGDTFEEAAKHVHTFHYSAAHDITKFEKDIFSNALLPFYRFSRFNVPLTSRMLLQKPVYFANAGKVLQSGQDVLSGGPDPNDAAQAEWEKRGVGIRMMYDPKAKTYRRAMFDQWWGPAQWQQFFGTEGREILNMGSPLFKMPIELRRNYSLYKERKIEDYPGQTKMFMGVRMSAKAAYALSSVRLLYTVNDVLSRAKPEIGDPPSIQQLGTELIMRNIVGLSVYPRDPVKQKEYTLKELDKTEGYLSFKRKQAKARGNDEAADEMLKAIHDIHAYKKENKGVYKKEKQ